MTKEQLSSDRINYLIWRYLQETNYLATAVKLQQEWNIEDPQQLDFAPHVKHHALVAVLHRGLLYHESEREQESAQLPGRGSSTPVNGFFGPLPTTPPVSPHPVSEDVEENGFGQGRKRQVESKASNASPRQNGAPQAKRPKLSNGIENGQHHQPQHGSNGTETATPMDLDEQPPTADSHAYPSPQEVDQPVTPIAPVVTVGAEHGTQVDKVRELTAETTFLPLYDDIAGSSNHNVTGMSPASAYPVLLHCAWSPRDPSILVAAGTDALARLWTVSRTLSVNDPPTHVSANGSAPPYRDLAPPNANPSPLQISAMAWSHDGAVVALASEPSDGDVARVSIWAVDGQHIHTFSGFDPPVITLSWNPSSTLLLALMPEHEATLITIFHPGNTASMSYSLTQNNLFEKPLNVAWISETEFVVCGGAQLLGFRCGESAIELVRKFEVNQDIGLLANVEYDWRSNTLATSRDTGVVEIWDIHGQLRTTLNAHQGPVISLKWQPLQVSPSANGDEERLLATSGVDGVIKLWTIKASESKARIIDMKAPVVALAFTPDGAFLAGATSKQILIWKVEDVGLPRASWSRGLEPGWQSPKANGSGSQMEDHHSLSWDANGQRLAYGVNSQLAVIDFRR